MRVTIQTLDVVDGRLAGIDHQTHGEYPNATEMSLQAYIYSLTTAHHQARADRLL